MPKVANDPIDHQAMCWTQSEKTGGVEGALWAIAASLCKLAAATDHLGQHFGPEADLAAPTRGVETLAAAVDNIAEAIGDQDSTKHRSGR